jgi:hypothetical protein
LKITSENIKQTLLDSDDFGHELRVGHVLANIPPSQQPYDRRIVKPAEHGGTYIDQVTGKPRQFDYRCKVVSLAGSSESIFLAVECKNVSQEQPVVVCGRPRFDNESYHLFIQRPDDGADSFSMRVKGADSIYKPQKFVGKSIARIQIKNEGKTNEVLQNAGDSDIYERWSQSLASSHDLGFGAVYNTPKLKSSAFILPVVVLPNDSLWTFSYNLDGTADGEPKQVDEAEFYVDQKLLIGLDLVLTHVHFVTLKGLSELLSRIVTDVRMWDSVFSEAASVL